MAYQPKTGQKCSCKRGVMRDNCPTCEGTGWVIDFRAIQLDRINRQLARVRVSLAYERDNPGAHA